MCLYLFQQGSMRASSSHRSDLPSWRLLHQDFFVDSNPRIELVRNSDSLRLCTAAPPFKRIREGGGGAVHRLILFEATDLLRRTVSFALLSSLPIAQINFIWYWKTFSITSPINNFHLNGLHWSHDMVSYTYFKYTSYFDIRS